MPPPRRSDEALGWIRDAMLAGRYIPSVHFRDRLRERGLVMEDVFVSVEQASTCAPYTKHAPEHGGTCWRVTGPNVDGTENVTIGIEAFVDKKKRRCVLCTIFRPGDD
jgi:hypothetical protein